MLFQSGSRMISIAMRGTLEERTDEPRRILDGQVGLRAGRREASAARHESRPPETSPGSDRKASHDTGNPPGPSRGRANSYATGCLTRDVATAGIGARRPARKLGGGSVSLLKTNAERRP